MLNVLSNQQIFMYAERHEWVICECCSLFFKKRMDCLQNLVSVRVFKTVLPGFQGMINFELIWECDVYIHGSVMCPNFFLFLLSYSIVLLWEKMFLQYIISIRFMQYYVIFPGQCGGFSGIGSSISVTTNCAHISELTWFVELSLLILGLLSYLFHC